MGVMPINIPIPVENSIASYNYADISEGTGITSFYGAAYGDTNSGIGNILTTRQLAGMGAGSGGSANIQADTIVLDKDFDVEFNTPKTIKGKMLAHISYTIGDSSCGSHNEYMIIKVRKVSGGVESEIVSVQSDTTSGSANNTYYYSKIFGIEVPLTNFKKGDKLRITQEFHVTMVSSTVAANWSINGDPLNTANASYSFTYFRVDTPFRLNT